MRALSLITLALAGLAQTEASDIAKLRRLMTDSRFIAIISPCRTGGTNRQNAAEWLRTAFHDSASHNAAEGTGGVDASIQYETSYSENAGVAFSSTIQQYKFYQQEGVTLADMVALGAIVAVGSCGGPMIPFLHGRTDASNAVPEGSVPHPEESTETHVQRFARMGFSPTEMISLVACGHTLGGVHASVNPTITNEAHAAFDDSLAAYDNHIATNYINNQYVNPLAQPWDATYPQRSSDARIFASDGNKTIKAYADSNQAYLDGCNTVLSKMLNEVSLKGPIVPFPVSLVFRMSLRNERYSVSIASAQVYDMQGQWSSFDIGYLNRDGSPGTDPNFLMVRDVKTLSIGRPVEVRNILTPNGIPPSTGIGGLAVRLTMNDGSQYTSAEGEEFRAIDDSIIIDVGPAYSCQYSGTENNGATGLNVTMAVLGPYIPGDRVDVVVNNGGTEKMLVRATYRRARDAYYNYYSVFIPDINALGLVSIGAQVTRASGKVSTDTRDGELLPPKTLTEDGYYPTNVFNKCLAGATFPTDLPPSPSNTAGTVGGVVVRRARKRQPADPCPRGRISCGGRCVDVSMDIEHCGGCAGEDGVDCTTLSNGGATCVKGRCVLTEV